MKREDIIALIQKELDQNPEITSKDISKKYRIPFKIVEIFRTKIEKNV